MWESLKQEPCYVGSILGPPIFGNSHMPTTKAAGTGVQPNYVPGDLVRCLQPPQSQNVGSQLQQAVKVCRTNMDPEKGSFIERCPLYGAPF